MGIAKLRQLLRPAANNKGQLKGPTIIFSQLFRLLPEWASTLIDRLVTGIVDLVPRQGFPASPPAVPIPPPPQPSYDQG